MAAERKAISGKLKLVISYNDENDNLCEKIRTDAQPRHRCRTGQRHHGRQRHRYAVRRSHHGHPRNRRKRNHSVRARKPLSQLR